MKHALDAKNPAREILILGFGLFLIIIYIYVKFNIYCYGEFAMIIKCPNCNGALEYEPVENKMNCKFCGSCFEIDEFENGKYVGFQSFASKNSDNESNQNTDSVMIPNNNVSSRVQDTFNDSSENAAASKEVSVLFKGQSLKKSEKLNPFWTPMENECALDGEIHGAQVTYTDKTSQSDSEAQTGEEHFFDTTDTIECNIYTCTACGAELAINGVESSTFCAYCGQPTVVFSRVSKTLKPKYTIPFVITKDRAIQLVQSKLKKGFFVPPQIRDAKIEYLRGIYIPYWIVDASYYDNQIWKGTVKSGKSSKTVYFQREAQADFTNVTLDASRKLNNNSSQKLEPYDLRAKKEFNIGYMQGYYADRYDVKKAEIKSTAFRRIKSIFDDEVAKTISASSKNVIDSSPKYDFKKADYMMLPAWFYTIRYEGVPYTILVNGQNGKVVGGLPYNKSKVIGFIASVSAAVSCITIPMSILIVRNLGLTSSSNGSKIFIYLIFFAGIFVVLAMANFKKLANSEKLSKEAEINQFVRDRQEEN